MVYVKTTGQVFRHLTVKYGLRRSPIVTSDDLFRATIRVERSGNFSSRFVIFSVNDFVLDLDVIKNGRQCVIIIAGIFSGYSI